jgi:hypothetical protein
MYSKTLLSAVEILEAEDDEWRSWTKENIYI